MQGQELAFEVGGDYYWPGKWNYRYSLQVLGRFSPPNKDVLSIKENFKKPFIIDCFSGLFLEENYLERKIIQACIWASQKVLQDLGLPPVSLSLERNICLVSYDDFLEEIVIPFNDNAGAAWYGCAYIPRLTDKSLFICILAHQLAHLCSFYALSSKLQLTDSNNQACFWEMRTSLSQSGFLTINQKQKKFFLGLNEGITEIFAYQIKKNFLNFFPSFPQAKNLLSTFFYWDLVVVVECLLKILAPKPEANSGLTKQLLTNYITGKKDFLKKVNRKVPFILPFLANLDLDIQTARSLIKRLRFSL